MTDNSKKGVSVILCCYNSNERIRETLQALAKQQFISDIFWEIILVDNASTDNTAEISRSIWENLCPGTEMHIVFEPRPGLMNARNKGMSEASCSILLFCDDDNWLAPDYIQGVFDILENDPSIAACGGLGLPVFETPKPSWFDEYAEAFAVGSQQSNDENSKLYNLYGAGLAIKSFVVKQLYASGFRPILQGRTGNKLSSAEDTELTYAFVLMGYRLYFAKELNFYHYLPEARLNFIYLKKLFVAFGTDGPVRNLYYAHLSDRMSNKSIKNWNFHLAVSLLRLFKYFIIPPKKQGRIIYLIWSIAYIKELCSIRNNYKDIRKNISLIEKRQKTKIVKKIWTVRSYCLN